MGCDMGSFKAHHASLFTFSTRTNAKQAQVLKLPGGLVSCFVREVWNVAHCS